MQSAVVSEQQTGVPVLTERYLHGGQASCNSHCLTAAKREATSQAALCPKMGTEGTELGSVQLWLHYPHWNAEPKKQ